MRCPTTSPRLSGKALVLMRQGRTGTRPRKPLREAVRLHPWLKERHMVVIKQPGEDL
jgi:hypothetical protein